MKIIQWLLNWFRDFHTHEWSEWVVIDEDEYSIDEARHCRICLAFERKKTLYVD